MQIVYWIMFLIVIAVAIYYWINFEKSCECILDLEDKLDEQIYACKKLREKADNAKAIAEKEIKTKLYKLVFQSQNFKSYEDLQNKIKTVLTSDQTN